MTEKQGSGTISPDKMTFGPYENGLRGLKRLPLCPIKTTENAIGYSFSGPLTVLIRTPLQDGSTCETIDIQHLSLGTTIEVLPAKSME